MLPRNLGHVTGRHLAEHDYALYIALERDAAVKKYVQGPSSREDDELLATLRCRTPDIDLLAIAENKTDVFIGRCGLLASRVRTELEIYCLVEQNCWGQGVGASVIQFLCDLAHARNCRVIGIVHPANTRSIALLAKLAWVQRCTISQDGKQHGHLLYDEPCQPLAS